MKIGDPLDEETQIGPLARADLYTTIVDQIERGLNFSNGFELEGERVEHIYGGEFFEETNSVSPLIVEVPNCQFPLE